MPVILFLLFFLRIWRQSDKMALKYSRKTIYSIEPAPPCSCCYVIVFTTELHFMLLKLC